MNKILEIKNLIYSLSDSFKRDKDIALRLLSDRSFDNLKELIDAMSYKYRHLSSEPLNNIDIEFSPDHLKLFKIKDLLIDYMQYLEIPDEGDYEQYDDYIEEDDDYE